MANVVASRPKARGAASEAMSMAAIAANITMRTPPSSGSTVLVSHAYADHAHHSTLSSRPPRSTPPHVGSLCSRVVTSVKANTKTRSKNSSSGTTVSRSSRSTWSASGTRSVRAAILVVGDVITPCCRASGDGDVGHEVVVGRTVPVLLTIGGDVDVAGPDLDDVVPA